MKHLKFEKSETLELEAIVNHPKVRRVVCIDPNPNSETNIEYGFTLSMWTTNGAMIDITHKDFDWVKDTMDKLIDLL